MSDDPSRMSPRRLPIAYRAPDGKVVGRDTSVVKTPSEDEVRAFTAQRPTEHCCGGCKYFELKKGQQEMMKQRFAERLVREEKWQMHHLGAPYEMVGVCGASNGEMATTAITVGCDQYRARNGRIG